MGVMGGQRNAVLNANSGNPKIIFRNGPTNPPQLKTNPTIYIGRRRVYVEWRTSLKQAPEAG